MLAALLLASCAVGQPAAHSADLLERIRGHMADNLARLPNYTCRLTIERSLRPARSRRHEPIDTLRFEVSYVSGREMFGWPGGEKFEERGLSELAPGGTVGSGTFALHARAIFTGTGATFTWAGETVQSGRRVVRFDYRIPRHKSQYIIRSGEAAGFAGYHGWFEADAATLDLVRLRVETDDIPPNVPVSHADETMEYARAQIGASGFLLPRASTLNIADLDGTESRNRTAFDACRQYTGDSTISFSDKPAARETAAADTAAPPIPAGVEVDMVLDGRLDVPKAAIGDPVTATVMHDVKKDGATVIPKGAVMSGRLTRIDRGQDRTGPFYIIGLLFETVRYANTRAPFRGSLESVGFAATGIARYTVYGSGRRGPAAGAIDPGEGVFAARSSQNTVFTNVRMTWRTIAP